MINKVLILLMGLFGLLVCVNALSHIIMGHEWTLLVFNYEVTKVLCYWPMMSVTEFKAQVDAPWLPDNINSEFLPFTPLLYITYVIGPLKPMTLKLHCLGGALSLSTGFL